MVTIGVDAHKRIHVALAVDDAGHELGQWRGGNTPKGWLALQEWAVSLGAPRQWGVEGAWSYGRGLAQQLVEAEETVYEINPRWTALRRRGARKPGKSDRLDAQAVALFVRQEAPDLPCVLQDDETAVLNLLATEREAALNEATRLQNQLHALLLQLDPEYRLRLPVLDSAVALRRLEDYTADDGRPLQVQRAATVRRLGQRLRLALAHIREVTDQIKRLAEACFSPLTEICGVSYLTAGTLAGILGPGRRFKNEAELAAYAGGRTAGSIVSGSRTA